jgi:predicted alpha/beta superfamily hydrolase
MYWEMDEEKVAAIQDHISEYHLYDEELDMGFTVHVIIPPVYEEDRSYPALVMTDAVWRFNDVTSMYDAMSKGKAGPQILVTIGFEYDVDGWDNEVRGNILCNHKKEFLDFITDNLMRYLGSVYNFDYDNSTLFGHSQGGVFTHYAAFNYDLYENKPFKNYIIGSPTFWTPYFTCVSDYNDYKNEYGYFDRNESYDRNLFITAGDEEDEDYEEYYGDNDSTLEGVENLRKRLDGAGVTTYGVKIYNSNHFQYVPEMLLEYIKSK